jgi:hypothetical protein
MCLEPNPSPYIPESEPQVSVSQSVGQDRGSLAREVGPVTRDDGGVQAVCHGGDR